MCLQKPSPQQLRNGFPSFVSFLKVYYYPGAVSLQIATSKRLNSWFWERYFCVMYKQFRTIFLQNLSKTLQEIFDFVVLFVLSSERPTTKAVILYMVRVSNLLNRKRDLYESLLEWHQHTGQCSSQLSNTFSKQLRCSFFLCSPGEPALQGH